MEPWLDLLNVYATAILHIFNLQKIMRLKGSTCMNVKFTKDCNVTKYSAMNAKLKRLSAISGT